VGIARRWQTATVTPIGVVLWSEAARLELPARAKGRRLVLDYFASRCCGTNVSVGDLSFRWQRPDQLTDELVPVAAPDGLDVWVQQELVPVLRAARGRVEMRGLGRLRHPSVELEDGAVWLDFVGRSPNRSPFRH
jgi:hypothetical protein